MLLLESPLDRIDLMAFSSDGRWLMAAARWDGAVILHDFRNSGTPRPVPFPPEGAITIRDLNFTPDATQLVGSWETSDWHLPTWEPDHIDPHSGAWRLNRLRQPGEFDPLSVDVHRFIFSADGTLLLVLGGLAIHRWTWPDKTPLPKLTPDTDFDWWPLHVVLSPNASVLVTNAAYSARVRLWNLGDGREITRWQAHPRRVCGLAYHPTEPWILTAGPREIRLWNASDGTLIRSISKQGPSHIAAMSLSPDGGSLAVGHGSGEVDVYATHSWERHATFEWPIPALSALIYAPDGLRLAAAGRKRVVIWDADE